MLLGLGVLWLLVPTGRHEGWSDGRGRGAVNARVRAVLEQFERAAALDVLAIGGG